MAIPILVPSRVASALTPDVVAAWAGTDRPTVQALLAAGLPIPIEDVAAEGVEARLAAYSERGVAAEAALPPQWSREWLTATGILVISAIIFKVGSSADALMDLSMMPLMGGIYTFLIALVRFTMARRSAEALAAELTTARSHLSTAAPADALTARIRGQRRAVVEAEIPADLQARRLARLFDLEATEVSEIEAEAVLAEVAADLD